MKNCESIFGIPDPASFARTVLTPQEMQRIIRTAFVPDTDLDFQIRELIAILETDQIQRVPSTAARLPKSLTPT
jgi:hypothetical protein